MKKIILILIIGILLISLVGATRIEKKIYNNFCGVMANDNIISYNRNPKCFCPGNLEKTVVWIQPYCPPGMLCAQYFFPAYTCETANKCNTNKNICKNVCGGDWVRRCTTDVPPSVCDEFCLI